MATPQARMIAAACRLGAALMLGLVLLAAAPARAADPVTDPEVVQDLARAETLIALGSYDEAVEILKGLASRGFVRAAVRLADLLYDEIALVDAPGSAAEERETLDLAIDFYRQATSVDGSHYDQASRRLARLLLLREGDREATRTALDQLRRLIVLGSGPAAYDLGRAYLFGRGVAGNAREGERYLRMAMDMGEFKAARLFGIVLARGVGRPPDPREALHYLQLALDHGDHEAARYLAETHALLGEYDLATAASGTEIEMLTRLYASEPQSAYAMRLAELYLRDPYWPQDPANGIEWLNRALANDTGLAAYRLFQIYASESFGQHDAAAALGYAEQVVAHQYWDAIPTVSHHYLRRACDAPDQATAALGWLETAADAGHADSMHVLSQALGGRWPCIEADPPASRYWLISAAVAGWGTDDQLLDLARAALAAATDPTETADAIALLEIAASRDDLAAKTELAEYLVEHGAGDTDVARGLQMLRRIAVQDNDARAMTSLARTLLYSADAAEREQAMVWLERAAGYGRPDAFRLLGRIYLEGMVAPPDPQRAVQLLAQGLAYGDQEAGLMLADLYQSGIGGAIDLERARAALEQAALLGSAEAMLRLSDVYRLGLGVDVQPDLADDLLSRAAAAGHPQAQSLLEATAAPPVLLPAAPEPPPTGPDEG